LAEAAGLNPKDIHGLLKGAFLHDIGKIGIPDAILHKPGSLSEAEKAVMQSHVQYGLEIVGNAAWLSDAASIVGCHHERFDGGGYPNGVAGDAIPLTARIFAIADVFDALTSERPYKKAYGIETAMEILRRGAGHHFDPELLAIFEPLAPALLATVAVPPDELPRLLEAVAMPYSGFDRRVMNA
jgi:HD-GYP domain-containing protein (c-di-GMP phosphodiesterase class II)